VDSSIEKIGIQILKLDDNKKVLVRKGINFTLSNLKNGSIIYINWGNWIRCTNRTLWSIFMGFRIVHILQLVRVTNVY